MQTRNKIIILLFTATVALGSLILSYAGDHDASLLRFRALLLNNPVGLVTDEVMGPSSGDGLWYGVLSIFAIIMIGVILKWVSGAELRSFRERLVQSEVEKAELQASLQDLLWKEKHARQARDAAVKDLEVGVNRVYALENLLLEKERLLQSLDQEFEELKSAARTPSQRPGEPGAAKAVGESALEAELKKRTELLRANEFAREQLESNLTGKVKALEAQLSLKDKLLTDRDKELEAIREQITREEAARHSVSCTVLWPGCTCQP